VAQVVEYLPSKCEALSSNPSTENKIKQKLFKISRTFHQCLCPIQKYKFGLSMQCTGYMLLFISLVKKHNLFSE
jgi:hypothetical protein